MNQSETTGVGTGGAITWWSLIKENDGEQDNKNREWLAVVD